MKIGHLPLLVVFLFSLTFCVSCNRKQETKINGAKYIPPVGYGFKAQQALSNAKGEIGNFSLLDHQGVFQELYRNGDAKAIVIISQSNDCPIIQKYSRTIEDLKKKYEPQKILFFMLNSSRGDDRTSLIKEAKEYGYTLPILMDPSQIVAESLGITRSSEAVVISTSGWKMIYRGAISDRLDYGVDKQAARNNYLGDVLDSFIANKAIATTAVPAKGCLISFAQPKSLSYEKVIAPLIVNKCLKCHSDEGGYLPRLTSYEKMKSWVAMSRETILTDRMPPFSADSFYGTYRNDISLSADEKRALVKWIDAGAPRDGNSDPLATTAVTFLEKKKKFLKKNPEPIYSVTMKPLKIAPGGENEYKYVQLGEAAPYDMWLTGGWTTSTNPRQLHHSTVMVTSQPLKFYEELSEKKFKINKKEIEANTDGDIFLYILNALNKYERRNASDTYLRFMLWGAGKPQPFSFKQRGVAFLPKGSYLVLETHYMGTGKEESEQTSVKFYGTKTKPKDVKMLRSYTLFNSEMVIPPMVKNYEVITPVWNIDKNIHLNHFLGHLHMRGKAAKLEMILPGGEVKTIVSIPNYYYGWQTGSGLDPVEPIAVKAGSQLRARCYFDNSPQNPNNPDPSKKVKWGQRVDRTEMCKINLNYTID